MLRTFQMQSAKYLGITISDNMDWGQHISEMASKATKTLCFLCRNLAFAPKSTKEISYKTLVRPKLEYAAPIWSPYSKLQINQAEKVQRTAARWTCRRWRNTSIVSARCLMSLSGHLLKPAGIGPPCSSLIRYILVLKKNKYLTPAHSLKSTRASHSAQYCRYQTYSDALKNSFSTELFHSGMVFLLRLSIPRLLRSLGHSSISQNTAERFFLFFFLHVFCLVFVLFFVLFMFFFSVKSQIRTPWRNDRTRSCQA